MSIESGFHNSVRIYKMNHIYSNRNKSQMANSELPDLEGNCRIVKGEKAIFSKDMGLQEGDIIEDIDTGEKYTVKDIKTRHYGASSFKYVKYPIERKRV